VKLKEWERKRSGFIRKYYPNDIKGGTKENYESTEDVQPVFGEIQVRKASGSYCITTPQNKMA